MKPPGQLLQPTNTTARHDRICEPHTVGGRFSWDDRIGSPMSNTRYVLGHESDELERLNVQGRALAAPTRILLEAAGLRRGMRVLDLGSGAGDMSFVVADVVGQDGEVVGLERAPEAIAEASARAERQGRANVRFVPGDIHDRFDDGSVDAVVCRLVLMYVPDPSAVLRTQAGAVRPGGIVAPIEFDVTVARTIPATQLASQALSWSRLPPSGREWTPRSGRACGGSSSKPGSRQPECSRSNRTSDPAIQTVMHCSQASSERSFPPSSRAQSRLQPTSTSTRFSHDSARKWRGRAPCSRSLLSHAPGRPSERTGRDFVHPPSGPEP
jgi:2-polyprenyl-3-methyl-5-hydroxy-6-metoxy-1,4-benzoquinol methylase